MPVVSSLSSQSRRCAASSLESLLLVVTRGRPPHSRKPSGPTYVAPGRSAVAAISVGHAPWAAVLGETSLIAPSRIDARPPAARPYWPLAARWVDAKPGWAASAFTGS